MSETVNSKQKGSRYEREVAQELRKYGYSSRRTEQYCGKSGDASDVVGLPGIHIECKHYKNKGFSYDWLEQAQRDAKQGELPCVFHRTDRHKTVVTMDLETFLKLYQNAPRLALQELDYFRQVRPDTEQMQEMEEEYEMTL